MIHAEVHDYICCIVIACLFYVEVFMRIIKSKKLVFISKPRCGSTSFRRLLDDFLEPGDIKCDYAGQIEGLHPHMPLPAIKKYIDSLGEESDEYRFFITIRNPLDMMWSYYKFFKPDVNFKYNFDPGYQEANLISFNDWLLFGRLGLIKFNDGLYPSFVNYNDFSALSLEAHVCDRFGKCLVDSIFKLEESLPIQNFISSVFSSEIKIKHVNGTDESLIPKVSDDAISRLRNCMPLEAALYNI